MYSIYTHLHSYYNVYTVYTHTYIVIAMYILCYVVGWHGQYFRVIVLILSVCLFLCNPSLCIYCWCWDIKNNVETCTCRLLCFYIVPSSPNQTRTTVYTHTYIVITMLLFLSRTSWSELMDFIIWLDFFYSPPIYAGNRLLMLVNCVLLVI